VANIKSIPVFLRLSYDLKETNTLDGGDNKIKSAIAT
jgi:hypothetical protein